MDILAELHREKERIDSALAEFLERVERETRAKDAFVGDAVAHMARMVLHGGKRLRPIMVCWGYRAMGGTDEKAITTASISMELIHTFLLMHDDIIDRDDVRHGVPTLHAHYADYFRKHFGTDDAAHFGASMGIVMGDYTYSIGNQALFSAGFAPEVIVRALKGLQSVVGLTVVGEMQDVRMSYARETTRDDILTMYENKTARYTFDGPLTIGSVLAGADDATAAQWAPFAVPLGVAFQIHDDLLGVFGDEEKTGKPVGSDIAEGKMTLLVRDALDTATSGQRKQLRALLAKGATLTPEDVAQFRAIVTDVGAHDRIRAQARDYIAQARTALAALSITPQARVFLDALADHMDKRQM